MNIEFDYPCDLNELSLGGEQYAVTCEAVRCDNGWEIYIKRVMLLINGQDVDVQSLLSPALRQVFRDEACEILREAGHEFRKQYRHVEYYA